MLKYILIIAMVLILAFTSFAIPPNDLPFGSYGLSGMDIIDILPELRDSLGFNIFWDIFDYNTIDEMADFGITAIKQGDTESDSTYMLSYYHYAKIEAEEWQSKVRMYDCYDGYFDNGIWYVGMDSTGVLYGPNGNGPLCWTWDGTHSYIKMPIRYFSVEGGGKITYKVDVQMLINGTDPQNDSAVAYLKLACEGDFRVVDTMLIDSIMVSDFGINDSTLITLESEQFQLPDSVQRIVGNDTVWVKRELDWATAVIIQATGVRRIGVDYITIYDDIGRRLVEEGEFNSGIIANAEDYSDFDTTELWGWYMRDEPFFLNLPPINYISGIVRDTVGTDWNLITAVHFTQNYEYWYEGGDLKVLTPDPYPFSHTEGEDSVKYAGYLYEDSTGLKMQNRFNTYALRCRQAYDAASDNNGEFWIIPQCFKGGGIEGKDAWRKPTRTELSCQTYMALASGARGIIYWKYGWSGPYEYGYISGIYDTSGTRQTDLWEAIAFDINPYVKAIDSIFLQLDYNIAYSVNYNYNFDPPSGAWIDTIYAVSDTPNPDLGWFHVGQFTEGSDKYVMLVNRACSQGENNPAPAPSITATVRFNATSLGLGNYVEIIDIADSVDYISYDSILVFADTTLASSLGGVITYSTILGPGEGRLFKLVSAR